MWILEWLLVIQAPTVLDQVVDELSCLLVDCLVVDSALPWLPAARRSGAFAGGGGFGEVLVEFCHNQPLRA